MGVDISQPTELSKMKFIALFAFFLAFILIVAAVEEQKSSDIVEATNDLADVEGIVSLN